MNSPALRSLILGWALCQFGGAMPAVAADAGNVLESQRASFQQLLEDARTASGVPGLVGALVDVDETVVVATGLRGASPAAVAPLQPTDPMNIGSNFKAMTATVAARLVQQGQVSWDGTFAELFPEYRPSMDTTFQQISLRELLSHRGGVNDEVVLQSPVFNQIEGTASEIRAQAVPLITGSAPTVPRGEYSYSNLGYAMAGAMLERATGKTFDTLVEQELNQGLGMSSLTRGSPGTADFNNPLAPWGHNELSQPQLPSEEFSPLGLEPAGLYSVNLQDWAQYARLHLGLNQPGVTPLSAELLAALHTPVGGPTEPVLGIPTGYALGWVTIELDGQNLLFHNGSNGSWYSFAVLAPETGRALLLASNQFTKGTAAVEPLVFSDSIRNWLAGAAVVPEPGNLVSAVLSSFLLALACALQGKMRNAQAVY